MTTKVSNTFSVTVTTGLTASGVSGTIADGETITITGTGFGTKPNGHKPLFFVELGKGQTALDSDSRGSWTTDWNASIAQNTVAPNRTHSMEQTFATGGAINSNGMDVLDGKTHIYTMQRFYLNVDGTNLYEIGSDYNVKHQRFWYSVGTNNLICPANQGSQSGDGNAAIGTEYTGAGTNYYQDLGALGRATDFDNLYGFRKNEWVTDEWQLKQSSAVDVKDATLTHYRGGYGYSYGPTTTDASGTFVSRATGYPNLYRLMYWMHLGGGGAHDPSYKAFVDFVYVDDSWCRVIISDEPTWDAASVGPEVLYEREPQVITNWTDTSITCRVRQGVHGSLLNKYIYVVDSSGTAQLIGQIT